MAKTTTGMRYLVIILIFLIASSACAQVPVIQRGSASQVTLDQREMAGMNFYPPRIVGKPTVRPSQLNGGVDTLGAMVFNILDSSYYKWIGGNVWEKDYNPRDTINTLATQSYVNRHGGSGAAVWGSITGNIANQTDLVSALNQKINYPDTNSLIATRFWVTGQGFIKTEVDPIAQAKTVFVNPGYGLLTPGGGIPIALGSNPSFNVISDTTLLMPFTDTLKVISGIATKNWGLRTFIPWTDTGRAPINVVTGYDLNFVRDSITSNVVTSFNGRNKVVVPITGDYNYSQVTNAAGLPATQTYTGTNTYNSLSIFNGSVVMNGLSNGAATDSLVTIIGGAIRKVPSSTYLQNITGYITAGTNIGITGLGTLASPYQISSSGGTGGGSVTQVNSGFGIKGGPITVSGTLTADTIALGTRFTIDSVARLISSSNTITNVGSAQRAVITNLNQVRTFAPGYGLVIDSTTTANSLTFTPDTTKLIPYTDTLKAFGIATQAWVLAHAPSGGGGVFRVSPIDSASVNSANGITITGVNLRPQSANYVHPGMMPDTSYTHLDSLYKGLIIDSISVSNAGTFGVNAIYAQNGGVVGKRSNGGYGIGVTSSPDSTNVFTADTTKLIPYTDTLKVGGIATQTYVNNHSGGGGAANNPAIIFPYGGRNGPPTIGGDSSYTNTTLIGSGKVISVQLVQIHSLVTTTIVDSVIYANNGGIYTSPWFSYNSALGRVVFHNFNNIPSLQNDSFYVVIQPSIGFPATLDLGGASTLTRSPTSLTGFTTSTGSPSTSQTFSLTGANLTANAILTSPAGFQISTDNATWFSAMSVPQSGGNISATIFVRLDTVVSGSYSGNVNISSTGASSVTVALSGSVTAPVSAIFNFSPTAASAAGATNFFGNPTTSLSFTDAGSGWTLVNIPANWVLFSGSFFGNTNTGVTTGSQSGTFSQAIGNNDYYTSSSALVDTATGTTHPGIGPHLRFTNLPAGTYDITLWGTCPQSFFNLAGQTTIYGVEFGTGSTLQYSHSFNPNGTGTFNTMEVGPGSHFISSGSFTGTITSGQTIDIFIGSGTSGSTPGAEVDIISGLKITKH